MQRTANPFTSVRIRPGPPVGGMPFKRILPRHDLQDMADTERMDNDGNTVPAFDAGQDCGAIGPSVAGGSRWTACPGETCRERKTHKNAGTQNLVDAVPEFQGSRKAAKFAQISKSRELRQCRTDLIRMVMTLDRTGLPTGRAHRTFCASGGHRFRCCWRRAVYGSVIPRFDILFDGHCPTVLHSLVEVLEQESVGRGH